MKQYKVNDAAGRCASLCRALSHCLLLRMFSGAIRGELRCGRHTRLKRTRHGRSRSLCVRGGHAGIGYGDQ
jgi:hypothetical protein